VQAFGQLGGGRHTDLLRQTIDARARIAGVEIGVALGRQRVSLEGNLLPFCTSTTDHTAPDLLLDLAPPSLGHAPLTSCAPASSVIAERVPDGFWFHRPSRYSLLASADLARWQVWGADGDTVRHDRFDGRPFLQFALWGYLSRHAGARMHSAVCVLEGQWALLLGDAETGKTTLSQLIVGSGYTCLTDEHAVLTWSQGAPWVHGTPWPGIAGPVGDLSGPLAAVFLLRHAPENVVGRVRPATGVEVLLRNTRFFLWDPSTKLPTIDLVDRTARSVPIYDFGFAPTPEAVDVLREVL